MAETAPKRGGFVTDRRLVADLTDGGCCGAPAETGSAATSSSCCGEPVAAVEPAEESQGCGCCGETTAAAAPAAGCCA